MRTLYNRMFPDSYEFVVFISNWMSFFEWELFHGASGNLLTVHRFCCWFMWLEVVNSKNPIESSLSLCSILKVRGENPRLINTIKHVILYTHGRAHIKNFIASTQKDVDMASTHAVIIGINTRLWYFKIAPKYHLPLDGSYYFGQFWNITRSLMLLIYMYKWSPKISTFCSAKIDFKMLFL